MPMNPIISQIFKEVKDSSYIIRLLDYVVNTKYERTEFIVGTNRVVPLITGVLKCSKTNQHYYSLSQFYNSVSDNHATDNEIEILKHIYVTKKFTLWRVLCNITDECVLGFFDQKYRSFLLYKHVGKTINELNLTYSDGIIPIYWNEQEYELYPNKIICKYTQDNIKIFELLEAYESGKLERLYYLYNKDISYLLQVV